MEPTDGIIVMLQEAFAVTLECHRTGHFTIDVLYQPLQVTVYLALVTGKFRSNGETTHLSRGAFHHTKRSDVLYHFYQIRICFTASNGAG